VKAAAASAGKGASPPKPAASAAPPAETLPAGDGAAKIAPAAAPPPRQEAVAPAPVSKDASPRPGHNRMFSSPLARRLAKEAGIDIGRIAGSGPHGRVIARDIDAAKSGQGLRPGAASPGGAAIAPTLSDQQIRALYEEGSYDFVPHDGMRRTIAQRLTASVQTVPHFYLTVDCDIGRLLAAREEINASAPKDKDGSPRFKLSVNDFVIKALA